MSEEVVTNQNTNSTQSSTQTEPTQVVEQQPEMVDKKALDKALKEKAELQRQLNAKKTEDEKAKDIQEEKDKELELLREFQKKSTLQNGLLTAGVNANDVSKIADAIIEGDVEKMSSIIGEVIKTVGEEATKNALRDALNNTATPNGSFTNKEVSATDFKAMNVDERMELKANNPELYAKLKSA